ncbi:radical SAM/SPASM domain-containing protein [Sporomusa malonica]|uniref:Radical SAM additional 4Fe4S-binding SPASM domain-containing protein n=1 Tax=Sporomusa malonica TaxID=112901 RepID=A0A1W2BA00_9FIRM|nr:radical SAM protein [Sporomusa malonica]SMC69795.1 radical SAM additional 4Fe4S-binding SPASM domain-containing protein [Sporomusa malonica]
MRYAKLTKDWLLRGWSDEPRTIINWTNGDCRSLSEQAFFVAQACDGLTDFHSIDVLPQHNDLLDKMIKRGMVEECAQGDTPAAYQLYRRADNPYVKSIHWAVTGLCNLKCRHCFMECPEGRYGELPLKDILGMIVQFVRANVHQVELTGGEPFLRQDLPEIMSALRDNHIAVSQIYSNGLLITDDILGKIKEFGFLPHFQISFDGCGTHDGMRGLRGIEQATVQAIRRLRAHGFPVTIATSVDRTNIGALPETYALMKQLDIKSWRVGSPQKIGDWRRTATALSLEELMTASAPIAARWLQDGKPFSLQLASFTKAWKTNNQEMFTPGSYDCTACRVETSVLPDGTVIPCPGFTDTVSYAEMPNLLNESFSKIWSQSTLRSIIDLKKSDILATVSECATCEQFKICGTGCRAAAVMVNGELRSKDPDSCEIYKKNYLQRFQKLTVSLVDQV